MQRQVYSSPARTAEERKQQNPPLVPTDGDVWYGDLKIARLQDGELFSVVTHRKFARLDKDGNVLDLEGNALCLVLEHVNGGGRIPKNTDVSALQKFNALATLG